jgi:protein SCO1
MISRITIKNALIVIVMAGIGIVIGVYTEVFYQSQSQATYMEGVFWPDPKQIGAFEMSDQYQNQFTVEQLKGHWTFLFFGYTNCPDVCPTTMATLNEVSRLLSSDNFPTKPQVIFVTVDPERDTLDKLAGYVGHFNNDFIALGGTQEQLTSLANQIGITYYYDAASADGSYLVSHTGSIFLLDADARLISIFSQPLNPHEIQSRFIEIESFISNQD